MATATPPRKYTKTIAKGDSGRRFVLGKTKDGLSYGELSALLAMEHVRKNDEDYEGKVGIRTGRIGDLMLKKFNPAKSWGTAKSNHVAVTATYYLNSLVEKGIIEKAGRGRWKFTSKGRQKASRLTVDALKKLIG